MSKNRVETIIFSVFSDFTVHIEVTKDIAKAIRQYPSIADMADKTDGEADGITLYNGNQLCFVFLSAGAPIGTLAHEAFHVVESMMTRYGIELEGETPAYHIGYLTERMFKFMRKRR
jgi:hypothetical protein